MSEWTEPATPGYVSLGGDPMSKLKDLVSRGVRLIVTEPETGQSAPAPDRSEREIEAAVLDVEPPQKVARSSVPAAVEGFQAVYDEAGITLPDHGYGIDKVGEMLGNKRLATLAREAR